MKKDKLITIRVNELVREKFNQWCNQQGLSASEFLSNIIDDCVSDNYLISSNNKDKSQKVARQKLIALEAKIADLSSQVASFTLISQEGATLTESASQQVQPYFDIANKVGVLEKQIENILGQGNSISNLIENKLDKNDLDGLIQSKIDSVLQLNSLSQKLDDKLDTHQVEILVQSKIDSIFDFDSLLEMIDNKLDKKELKALLKSQVKSILSESNLLKQIDSKLNNTIDKQEVETLVKSLINSTLSESNLLKQIDSKLNNTIDKQEVETLVKSLVNSTFNQDSLLKVIDKMIDDKLREVEAKVTNLTTDYNHLSLAIDSYIDKDTIFQLLDQKVDALPKDFPLLNKTETLSDKKLTNQVSSTFEVTEEVSIDNIEDGLQSENDLQIIEKIYLEPKISQQVNPEKEVTMELEGEKSIAKAIDDFDDTEKQIPLAFQQLSLGEIKVTVLAKSLGINRTKLQRVAEAIEGGKQPQNDFFPQLWDYVKLESIKNEDTKGKVVRVWTKIK
jgi:hypothetical protein